MRRKPKEGDLYPDPINGYVLIYHKGLWQRRNRLVLSQKLGRELLPNEVAHHIDGNRANDAADNLELMDSREHSRHHHTGRRNSEKTLAKMRKAAARRVELPGHRKHLSERAKAQHANGNLGRKTWAKETAERVNTILKEKGHSPEFTSEIRKKMRAAWTPERRKAQAARIRQYNTRKSA